MGYVAEAPVYHSHSYKLKQEFRRYFDVGVLHAREDWLLKEFGGTGGEGMRFVKSEIKYLWPRHFWLIPSALVRTALKLIGYRLGRLEASLGNGWKRRLSMNRQYWS
jgi:rhamnosyltransferase